MASFDEKDRNTTSNSDVGAEANDRGLPEDVLDAATGASGITGSGGPGDGGDLGRFGGGDLAGRDFASEGIDRDGGAAISGTDIGSASS